jgi:hypothetical protein
MQISKQKAVAAVLTAAIMACAGTARAQDQALQDRIKKLEDRIAELEGKGPEVAAAKGSPWSAWVGASKLSGFASASYLYNFNHTDARGRSFDVNHNEFSLNKLKLTLEKPVDYSGEHWDAGYRADLIFGQDAKSIQSAGLSLGSQGDLEQLYATVNIPVGRGLQVSAGKWVTLMGVEVIEETANPNWSEGNQFLFVENFTGTGVQLSYKWSDMFDTQFRIYNGWDVVKDNNDALSYMARIGVTPDDKTSIGVVGYAGPEQPNNSRDWRYGVNLVASRKLTPQLTLWVQGDYGREENLVGGTDDAEWWAGGVWVSYAFNDKVGVAVRGDYLKDKDGARTSGVIGFPAHGGQDLTSLTLTLNLTPVKNLQVRPELRWDHTSADLFGSRHSGAAGGRANQFTAGMGVAYLF